MRAVSEGEVWAGEVSDVEEAGSVDARGGEVEEVMEGELGIEK